MKLTRTKLPGVLLLEPDAFGDDRGWFLETWSQRRYAELGVPELFVQDSASMSRRGTVRGLHLQHPWGQGKLVQVVHGSVYDVTVDVRAGSSTFGQWIGELLSAEEHRQVYIPPGFAHGYCVTSEAAVFLYKCTEVYHRETELGVAWNDPDLAIPWPVDKPILSARDASFPRLRDIPVDRLPSAG
jgi:dTDP-4-dehydrorhamnose 3,5-epimerase